ncbi:hypothetical protein RA280_13685 [Cupriavidus sp. CV2]|uniref:hypothetical protein n=1 Tax=Cupriavidus ulmosensis TaxID=3065913 RepID=UPI00296A9EFB|nr:hypothetical protein [Cupriavidus sp. CV2]MDW3682776.1 hypothetical protein [Cupriavidus sp. CV2]
MMMKTTEATSSSELLAAANPQAHEHFKMMRAALSNAEALERKTYETVIAVQFALLGKETQFKIHAIQLFSLGMSREYVRAVVLAGVGVTTILCEAARVLTWADEAYDEFQARR